ncbi:MAG: glycosyltransferase family 2 protein [Planctomycetota bacterium]
MDGEHTVLTDDERVKITLSLVIPFYNEEPNVGKVLVDLTAALDAEGVNYEILAVNNGSRDATGERIQEMHDHNPLIVPVTIRQNRGYGYGILEGLRRARGEIVGYAWGDGQVSTGDVMKIYRAMEEAGADLAKAYRVKRHDGLYRLIQSRLYTFCFLLLFGAGYKDPNGCPKLFKRSLYEKAALCSHDWLLDPEIMLKARRMEAKIENVPVVFNKRLQGKSKVRWFTCFGFLLGLLRLRAQLPMDQKS